MIIASLLLNKCTIHTKNKGLLFLSKVNAYLYLKVYTEFIIAIAIASRWLPIDILIMTKNAFKYPKEHSNNNMLN